MKEIFAQMHKMMIKSNIGRNIWKIIRSCKIDVLLYLLADIYEPQWDKKMIQQAQQYFFKNKERAINVQNFLFDDYSKKVYAGIIKFRITGKRRYILKVNSPEKERYFMNNKYRAILPLKNESFVDCGACDGDTYKLFVAGGYTYRNYYAFEPQPNNCSALREEMSDDNKIEIYQYAVGSCNGVSKFDGGGNEVSACGKLSQDGKIIVNICSLDEKLAGKRVTFIKMDIEGAEMDALKGAKQIIQQQKPKMAISIYHKNSDIIDIAEYIKSIVPEYKILIRHYSCNHNESVLYAII